MCVCVHVYAGVCACIYKCVHVYLGEVVNKKTASAELDITGLGIKTLHTAPKMRLCAFVCVPARTAKHSDTTKAF